MTDCVDPLVIANVIPEYARKYIDEKVNEVIVCLNRANEIARGGNSSWFWGDESDDHVDVSNSSFQIFGNIIFLGTDIWTPDTFKAVANLTSGSPEASGDIRIFDFTNSNVIASVTVPNGSTTKSLFTDTTLANLPTSEAIFEIQARQTGLGSMFMHAAGMYNII